MVLASLSMYLDTDNHGTGTAAPPERNPYYTGPYLQLTWLHTTPSRTISSYRQKASARRFLIRMLCTCNSYYGIPLCIKSFPNLYLLASFLVEHSACCSKKEERKKKTKKEKRKKKRTKASRRRNSPQSPRSKR